MRNERNILLFCHEGDAEEFFITFLRRELGCREVQVKHQPLEGCGSLGDLGNKHRKLIRKINHKYSNTNKIKSLKIIFIVDNDVIDSQRIIQLIEDKGHILIVFNPNIEGFLLGLVGVKIQQDVDLETYRTKCKKLFKEHFDCEAHQMTKYSKWPLIFGKDGTNLDKLCKKNTTLQKIVDLLNGKNF